MKQMGDLSNYVELNQKLFDYTFDFDITNQDLSYEMPVYFISGSCDWVCPTDPISEYVESISAPDKDYVIIDGPGHNLQYSKPEEFAKDVKNVLEKTK